MKSVFSVLAVLGVLVNSVSHAEILKFRVDGDEIKGKLKIERVIDGKPTGAKGEIDCKKLTLNYSGKKYSITELDCAHAQVMLIKYYHMGFNIENDQVIDATSERY